MPTKTISFFVTGDIAKDYFLIRGERLHADDHHPEHAGTGFIHHLGVTFLIFELPEQIGQTRKANEYQAVVRIIYAKKHNCMVPFEKLSQTDQDKDIEIIIHYPEILDKAGYGIIKKIKNGTIN